MDPTKLGAREAAALIAEGKLTAVGLTEACLARIEERDGEVRAWAHLDPEGALAQARACDARAPAGPLHGVPVGVKDIIDTPVHACGPEGARKTVTLGELMPFGFGPGNLET